MMAVENMGLGCRMYEERYPKVGTVVMVYVKEIDEDDVAYVSLLEHNNIVGEMPLSELPITPIDKKKTYFASRQIGRVSTFVKVDRIEPMKVVRVDLDDEVYIELTKRDLTDQDVQDCEERYNKSKIVHSIMHAVAQSLNMDLEELYVRVGWPLYREHEHAFDALQIIHSAPHMVNELLPDEESENLKNSLVENIAKLINPMPLEIRADIEISNCSQSDAAIHLKKAIRMAEAAGLELYCIVNIELVVAAPLYVLTAHTWDEELGVLVLNNAIVSCTKSIEKYNGQLTVKEAPRVVNEHDD